MHPSHSVVLNDDNYRDYNCQHSEGNFGGEKREEEVERFGKRKNE